MIRPALRALPILIALLASCAQTTDPSARYVLRGTLRDAATNAPISRQSVYLHFFCDDVGVQKSLDPDDAATFEVALPSATVRVRAFDKERTYAAKEETFTLAAPETARDVTLQPTGYVLLRGRVIDAATGAPIARESAEVGAGGMPVIGGGGPLFSFRCDAPQFAADYIHVEDDGSYALKVPRGVLRVLVVDTALAPEEKTIDLTKAEGPVFEHDLRMR